ncbi:MAG: AzlC family ABC transporter permease [Acetivibrionales bacterium]|jgi:predicted branched-subunit amino acid permease
MNRLLPKRDDYICGLKKGLPIALGYVPVSFTFGLMTVGGGLPPLTAVLISLTNLTSAGQFAGTKLILEGAGYLEIILATIVINARYMLMSLSLSQKIEPGTTSLQRLIFGFGITDETFSIALLENGKLSYSYMTGLITGPILGWTLGTALGAFISSALPGPIGNAMGIALYAMFIAIIVPPAKKSVPVLSIVLIAVAINIILKYIPWFGFISSGFRIVIAAVLGAGTGAALWPVENESGS